MKQEIIQVMPAALEVYVVPPSSFAELWQGGYEGVEEWFRRQWAKLVLSWLDAKEAKSKSPHTRRNYQRVLNVFANITQVVTLEICV